MAQFFYIGKILKGCMAGLILSSSAVTFAQESFPDRPLTLVVPFGAGSTTDMYARVLAEGLGSELRQAVVVENRPGAGGTVGIGQALRAPGDGYTLILITTSSIAINGSLYSSLAFNPSKDVSVIGITSTTPNALVVPATSKVKTFAEFSKEVRDGEEHFYNSQGSGTSQHLASVLLAQVLNAKFEHVPYKGQEGITGMLGGQTEFAFASLPSVMGLAKGNKLNVLALSGPKPAKSMPDVPTLVSLGYKDFANGEVWYGLGIKADTPASIKTKLSKALAKVAENPAIQSKLSEAGFDPMPAMSESQTQTYVTDQVKFWGALVKESGAKID